MISKRLLPLLATLTLAASTAACGDDELFRAAFSNSAETTFQVYALTGTPPHLPTAFSVARFDTLRVDSIAFGQPFDIAFDIAPDGRVVLYPLRTLGQATVGKRIGIRVDSAAFASIERAPVRGYVRDSIVTVPVGRTVIIETQTTDCSPYSISQNIYAKIAIDSAIAAERRIKFRAIGNPNCGFRSLRPSILPKD